MGPLLHIGSRTYTKTGAAGVFEVPLERLEDLRFIDVPYYSTVEIRPLGGPGSYELNVSATHGGGPVNEDFTVMVHVGFLVPGDAKDVTARRLCERRSGRVQRVFRPLVANGSLDDADGGNDRRTYYNGKWFCDVLYSASFTRDENPELSTFLRPVVDRFQELVETPDLYLFLCYASEDRDFVDWLADRLDQQDVDIWYDRREIRAGDSIVERIGEGLVSASHFVVVLSQAASSKPWVRRELSSALMRQLDDASVKVIPVLRESCDVPALLRDIRYADCSSDQEAGFAALVEALVVPGIRG